MALTTKKFKKLDEISIRSSEFKKKLKISITKDINYLLKKKKNFVKVNCPACNSKYKEKYFNKRGFNYVICFKCLTIYTSPRPTETILKDFYFKSDVYKTWAKYIFPKGDTARRKEIVEPRINQIQSWINKKKKLERSLEVGAGYGTFSKSLKSKKIFKKVIVIEPNKKLSEICKQKGLVVINDTFFNFKPREKFDLISSFEVVEHLFSPKNFLKKSYNLLKKDGIICLSMPNALGFDTLILKSNSTTFDHEHLNYFNVESFKILLRKIGFKQIEITTPGKLDVELVETSYKNKKRLNVNEKIVNQIFYKNSLIENNELQKFIFKHGLSSHMFILAKK